MPSPRQPNDTIDIPIRYPHQEQNQLSHVLAEIIHSKQSLPSQCPQNFCNHWTFKRVMFPAPLYKPPMHVMYPVISFSNWPFSLMDKLLKRKVSGSLVVADMIIWQSSLGILIWPMKELQSDETSLNG